LEFRRVLFRSHRRTAAGGRRRQLHHGAGAVGACRRAVAPMLRERADSTRTCATLPQAASRKEECAFGPILGRTTPESRRNSAAIEIAIPRTLLVEHQLSAGGECATWLMTLLPGRERADLRS